MMTSSNCRVGWITHRSLDVVQFGFTVSRYVPGCRRYGVVVCPEQASRMVMGEESDIAYRSCPMRSTVEVDGSR